MSEENYIWSAKNNVFIPTIYIKRYESEGWDLSDKHGVSDEIVNTFCGTPPSCMRRGVGRDGMPCWEPIPPLTYDELVTVAENQKSLLISSAMDKTKIWRTQLQLGIISDVDKAKLIEWMRYISALQDVDTSTVPNIEWPQQPTN